jgi:hypothetical protein
VEVAALSVVHVMVALAPGVPEEINEITGAALSTVTVTAAEVAEFPAASRATATIECDALLTEVLSQVSEYGDDVTSEPTFAPSTLNCTPTTPTLSEAVAESVTDDPCTVAPPEGAERETVGALYRMLARG